MESTKATKKNSKQQNTQKDEKSKPQDSKEEKKVEATSKVEEKKEVSTEVSKEVKPQEKTQQQTKPNQQQQNQVRFQTLPQNSTRAPPPMFTAFDSKGNPVRLPPPPPFMHPGQAGMRFPPPPGMMPHPNQIRGGPSGPNNMNFNNHMAVQKFGQLPLSSMANIQVPKGMDPNMPTLQDNIKQKQDQIGPKTTLQEKCQIHSDQLIIFENQSTEETWCEKCYVLSEQEYRQGLQDAQECDQEEKSKKNQEQLEMIDMINKLQKDSEENVDQEKEQIQLKEDLQNLIQNISGKIQKKHDSLLNTHQELGEYQEKIIQKYTPIFDQMKSNLDNKKVAYLTYLVESLNRNKERVQVEKESLQKLYSSYQSIQPQLKQELKDQSDLIKAYEKEDQEQEKLEREQKVVKEDKESAKEGDEDKKEQADEKQLDEVSKDKIVTINTILDDFYNVLGKNIGVFSNYEDFSFAKSRSVEQIEKRTISYFDQHFSGEFMIKNLLNPGVLPRIYHFESNTKFIYTYKILNYINQTIPIANPFSIPERSRQIITPEGELYSIGGYLPQIKTFLKNIFIFDHHRSLLVPRKFMNECRADHAVIYFKGNIYVFGGMSHSQSRKEPYIESKNSVEMYNIEKDSWTELQSFSKARQEFSVTHFNDRYMLIFGGKVLKPQAQMEVAAPFSFQQEVEVYEMEKNTWKVINYISDNQKLRVLNPGSFQISGKKVMIFGGLIESKSDDDDLLDDQNNVQDQNDKNNDNDQQQIVYDNGMRLELTSQSLLLDMTVGSIKRGNELTQKCYFQSGGSLLPLNGKLYAFGLGRNQQEQNSFKKSLAAKLGANQKTKDSQLNQDKLGFGPGQVLPQSKKMLHCFNSEDNTFSEIIEGIYSNNRKISSESLEDIKFQ